MGLNLSIGAILTASLSNLVHLSPYVAKNMDNFKFLKIRISGIRITNHSSLVCSILTLLTRLSNAFYSPHTLVYLY